MRCAGWQPVPHGGEPPLVVVVIARTGDPAVAAARFVDLLGLYREAGDDKHLLTTLRNVVPLLVRMGDHRSAATLFGATADHPLVPSFGPEAERLRVAAAECERHGRARLRTRRRHGSVAEPRSSARDCMRRPHVDRTGRTAEPRHRPGRATMAMAMAMAMAMRQRRSRRQDVGYDAARSGSSSTAAPPPRSRMSRGSTISRRSSPAPHSEVHALQLVGGAEVAGAADYVLDDAARTAYRRRIEQLRDEIERGRERGEERHVQRAEDELDALLAQLSAGTGPGRRPRATPSSHERARSTVTNRIRVALRKIDAVHPELGRHLSNTIRTGTWYSYRPEHDGTWIISTT